MAVGLQTHIYNNNAKSVLLLLGFPVLLIGMVWGFFFGIHLAGFSFEGPIPESERGLGYAWDAGVYGVKQFGHWAIGAALIWFAIAWCFHTRMIRSVTGSVPVTRKEYPKIYNMLENLCISRGIPMPRFEIIDSPALNAFASGINRRTYSITLTRGIIDRLEDDELEAVIAHELSHILNRDVRLLIISVIFVGMISFFAEMLFRSMVHGRHVYRYNRSRSNNKNNGGAVIFVALAVLAIGYLFAIVIRFALSRKREYLADAGAVELTKNPEAMMRALMRISGQDTIEDLPDDIQQMCIENSHNFMGMFATHPPIDDRVKAISEMTNTPVPQLAVSLKRGPRRPWDKGVPPEAVSS